MKEPIDADENGRAQAHLIGGFSRGDQDDDQVQRPRFDRSSSFNRPPAELKERIGQIEAVGAGDIQRYAAAHLGAANLRLALAGEAGAFGAALKAIEPGLVTVGQDALDLERSDGISRR